MTNQQAPEALALARAVDHWARCDYGLRGDEMRKAAAELRRLHYENERLAALVEAQQPATHVQNPAGIEHVAGDVSKNGPESNMTQQPSPTPQADSQPAPEYVGNGMFKGETIQKAAEHWANWCDVRCMTGLSEFLRVVAGRAPTDSVLEDAARLDWLALAGPVSICVVIDRPHDGEVEVATDDVTGYGKTLREALDAARKQGGAA